MAFACLRGTLAQFNYCNRVEVKSLSKECLELAVISLSPAPGLTDFFFCILFLFWQPSSEKCDMTGKQALRVICPRM